MKLRHVLAAGAVLVVGAALPALAFQEQQVGAPAASGAAPAAPPAESAVKPGEMQLTPADGAKPAQGTEVRIPGLGKLGVLPKMDFGLELLYGANEGNKPAVEPEEAPETDDLRIRGTMKHNF